MKNMSNSMVRFGCRWLATLAVLASVGLTPAIADNNSRGWSRWWTGSDIVQKLERDGRFTTLLTALEVAELKEVLQGDGPFTLLAPTDDAFAAVPSEVLEALLEDTDALSAVLLYHVIPGKNYSWQLARENVAETVQGDSVVVTNDRWHYAVNGRSVSRANVKASNGIIHILDGVLLPPEEPVSVNSVVEVLQLDGRFTTLLAAVDAAGLTDALATSPALTLFAPTDDAFAALPEGTVEALLADPEGQLKDILLYHVLGEARSARDLYRAGEATTLLGEAVSVSYRHWYLYVNDVKIQNLNVKAPNGFIHVIGSVLLPPEKAMNLVDLLQNDGRFSTLVAAVVATGLGDTLANDGPFTVFAPTDDAFDAVPPQLLADLLGDPDALKQVLLYHVVDGDRSLSELSAERRVDTLEGNSVFVWRWPWGGLSFVNRSRVIDADLLAENGRAQVINRVLLPPSIH
jgi:uncharacterized surface protein with fasciclin (FAS1) repeats